jgi:SOS-response transcriptional repressor LexA
MSRRDSKIVAQAEALPEVTRLVYDTLAAFMDANGYAPTFRQIMALTGISSTSVVERHITYLVDHGLIVREHGATRTIRLVQVPAVDQGDNIDLLLMKLREEALRLMERRHGCVDELVDYRKLSLLTQRVLSLAEVDCGAA